MTARAEGSGGRLLFFSVPDRHSFYCLLNEFDGWFYFCHPVGFAAIWIHRTDVRWRQPSAALRELYRKMKKIKEPHWIRHSHLFGPDEYECSVCGTVCGRKTSACPHCGAALRIVCDPQDWIDEEDEMNWLLEDD